MKKRIGSAILLILAIFGVVYVLKKTKSISDHPSKISLKYRNTSPLKKIIHQTARFTPLDSCKGVFRFDVIDSRIFLFTEKQTIQRSLINGKNNYIYPLESVYRAFKTGDTIGLFSDKQLVLNNYLHGKKISSQNINAFWGNVLVVDKFIYRVDTSTVADYPNEPHMVIKMNNSFRIDLSKALSPFLSNIPDETKSIYESGFLLNYTRDSIAYLFTKTDLLLILNVKDKKHRMVKTHAQFAYVPYKRLTATDPITGYEISTAESLIPQKYIHSSYATNDKHVYIAGNSVYRRQKNEPYEMIDVYEKYTFRYLYSIPFAGLKDGESIRDVRCTNDAVYILTSKGKIYSTNVPAP